MAHLMNLPIRGGLPAGSPVIQAVHTVLGYAPANIFYSCGLFCLQVSHPESGTVWKRDGTPGTPLCPNAPKTEVKARARASKRPRSRSRSGDNDDSDDDSDGEVPDSDPDIPEVKPEAFGPMDIPRAMQGVQVGSQHFIGDPLFAPGTIASSPVGMSPAAPDVSAKLLAMVERIFAARLLAEAIMECSLRNKPRAEVIRDHVASGGRRSDQVIKATRDVSWRRIVGPSAAKVTFTPYTAIKAAYFALVSSIGRDALAIHEALDPKSSSETTVRVRVGKSLKFVSWRTAAKAEHLIKVIQAFMALPQDPQSFLEAMTSPTHLSREYRLGLHIVKVGFSPERACPEAWAAIDVAAVQSRKRISKAFPDDVALAKAAKEREDKKEKDKPTPRDLTLTPPPPTKAAKTGVNDQSRKQKLAAKKAKILAAAPAARSNQDLRLVGFCLNCRDGSHSRASCKAAAVAFTG